MSQLNTTGELIIKKGNKIVAKIYNRPVFFNGKRVAFTQGYPYNLELPKQGVARECQTLEEVNTYLRQYTGEVMPFDEMPEIKFTRVNSDINGNPRYVCHYLEFLVNSDYDKGIHTYEKALERARNLGGRKFHNKQYGGGIVFSTYSLRELQKSIYELVTKLESQ